MEKTDERVKQNIQRMLKKGHTTSAVAEMLRYPTDVVRMVKDETKKN